MKQYCRYCAALTTANGIWCATRQRTLSESYTKRVNHCKDFEFNEIDAYDLDKRYVPRKPKSDDGQTSIFDIPKRTQPLCYDCVNARRRGKFRVCTVGGIGYKQTNDIMANCNRYVRTEEE